MNYAREGKSHLIISDQASVRDHLNIYQTESTLCTAKPGCKYICICKHVLLENNKEASGLIAMELLEK
jgi:hypothetical protein